MEAAPPDGFVPWSRGGSAVTDPWEPIYERLQGDVVQLGTFLRAALCNRRGLLHGGVIATLCDIAMGHSSANLLKARHGEVQALLTTQLSVDYVDKADNGWIEIRPRVVHAGASTAITDAIVCIDDRLIARATASFRHIVRR